MCADACIPKSISLGKFSFVLPTNCRPAFTNSERLKTPFLSVSNNKSEHAWASARSDPIDEKKTASTLWDISLFWFASIASKYALNRAAKPFSSLN